MATLSIVIPVHNAEKYLRECLDSCLAQTVEGLEIVCVDDASTDGSATILREFAERDSRIKVVTFPDNRGTFAARKAGTLAATGYYLIHADPDDYLGDRDGCQRLVETARRLNVDLLVFGHESICDPNDPGAQEAKKGVDARSPQLDRDDIPFEEYRQEVFVADKMTVYPWGKVLRADLVRETYGLFPEGYCILGEDPLFLLGFLSGAPCKVAAVTDRFYKYRLGSGASMDRSLTMAKRENIIRSVGYIGKCFASVPRCRDSSYRKRFCERVVIDLLQYAFRGCSKPELLELLVYTGGCISGGSEDVKALALEIANQKVEDWVPSVNRFAGRLMLVGLSIARVLDKRRGRDVQYATRVKELIKRMMAKASTEM